jgi:hypothetical protein
LRKISEIVASYYSSIYNSGKNSTGVAMRGKIFHKCLPLIGLLGILVGCTAPANTTTFVEPVIPANYTTYADEQSFFSISYPGDWEIITSLAQDAATTLADIFKSNNVDVPIDKMTTVFAAAKVDESGRYQPSVSIIIEPMPSLIRNIDQLAESEVEALKSYVTDYREVARTKTQVDGREATIIEWEGTYTQKRVHPFQMCMIVGGNAWTVSCSAPQGEVDTWRSDFNSIVRSLRIQK